MTDDQFSKAFKEIVPDSPSPDGWAASALRMRRNRGMAFAGVAGILAVALAVPIGMNLAEPRIVANPAETPSAETTADGVDPNPAGQGLMGAAACYDEDGNPVQGSTGEMELRDGAVRAWLCGDVTTPDTFGTVGPLEPLLDGVDQIVEFVEGQPELDIAAIMCTADYSLAYKVVLEYEDGTTDIVNGETHGCKTINYGTTYREGGVEFLDLLKGLWSDQRTGAEMPSDLVMSPPCPAPSVMLVPSLDDITSAVVCIDGQDENSYGSAELVPDLVARIVDEIKANAVEEQPADWGPPTLALIGGWGEWLALAPSNGGESYWFTDADGTPWTWTPSPELAQTLADATAEVPVTDQPPVEPTGDGVTGDPGDPVTPVDPVPSDLPTVEPLYEPEGCQGVQSGEVTTSELPGGVLPDDPVAVWLCGKGIDGGFSGPVGPMEPLTTAPQNAVNLYNALPEPNWDACTEELGPAYVVVHEYADGTRIPVEIQTYGCRAVVTGSDQKAEGMEYLDALLALWTDQRLASDATVERPGPLCPGPSSVFPVAPSDEFTAGYACNDWLAEPGTAVDLTEVPLPADLVAAISGQLAQSSFPDTFTSAPGGDTIVLVTRHGDPLTLTRLEDGTFQWWDGQEAMLWEPPSAIAEQIEVHLPS